MSLLSGETGSQLLKDQERSCTGPVLVLFPCVRSPCYGNLTGPDCHCPRVGSPSVSNTEQRRTDTKEGLKDRARVVGDGTFCVHVRRRRAPPPLCGSSENTSSLLCSWTCEQTAVSVSPGGGCTFTFTGDEN